MNSSILSPEFPLIWRGGKIVCMDLAEGMCMKQELVVEVEECRLLLDGVLAVVDKQTLEAIGM